MEKIIITQEIILESVKLAIESVYKIIDSYKKNGKIMLIKDRSYKEFYKIEEVFNSKIEKQVTNYITSNFLSKKMKKSELMIKVRKRLLSEAMPFGVVSIKDNRVKKFLIDDFLKDYYYEIYRLKLILDAKSKELSVSEYILEGLLNDYQGASKESIFVMKKSNLGNKIKEERVV